MSGRIDLTISAERGEHGEAYQGSGSSVNSDNRDGFQLSHLVQVLATFMLCFGGPGGSQRKAMV